MRKVLTVAVASLLAVEGAEAQADFLFPRRHHRRHHRTIGEDRRELEKLLEEVEPRLARRYRRHRRASFAAAGVRMRGVDDILEHPEVPEQAPDGSPMYKIHPLVGRQVARMDSDLADLKAAKSLAEQDQAKLGDVRADATAHMTQGISLKRKIEQAMAQERMMDQKLHKLQKEEDKMHKNNERLRLTIQKVMEPKMRAAEKRMTAKMELFEKVEKQHKTWEEREQEYRKRALARLEERKEAEETLRASSEALAEAQREQHAADERFRNTKRTASESVEQYRYVETRFQAVDSRINELGPEVEKEKRGLTKLQRVLGKENEKMEAAEERQRQQLQRIESNVQKQHEEKDNELLLLNQKYRDWQNEEQERASVIAQRSEAYNNALSAYQEKRSDVYSRAESNAARRANQDSDWGWDDWAWGGDIADPQSEEVHISDESPAVPDTDAPGQDTFAPAPAPAMP